MKLRVRPHLVLLGTLSCLGCSTSPTDQPAVAAGGTAPGGAGGGGATTTEVVTVPPGTPPPGAGVLRRLTPEQYTRALHDLVGLSAPIVIDAFPAGDSLNAIAASITAVTPVNVEQFEAATDVALGPVFSDPAKTIALVGCAPAGWDATCATSFVSSFGRRAWRRPLTSSEVARYVALGAAEAGDTGKFVDGAAAIASALLQSPNFLYRPEIGSAAPGSGMASRFTPYETASRLSFLFWGTIPDEPLLAAAESGTLSTTAGIQSEAARLLAVTDKLTDGVSDMVDDLLSLNSVLFMAKDATRYPELTPSLRQAMREEVRLLFQDVAIGRDADMLELFDTKRTFVNQELAALYGIPGVQGSALVAAQHPAGVPRAGLLTNALLLSVQDKAAETSPTRRGAFLRRVLTCDAIPDPPPNVSTAIPDPPDGKVVSRREKLAGHAKLGAACSACHSLMDPPGLALENFDALGKYRTKEDNGLVIDASGELDGQAFTDAAGLGALMRNSPKVRTCLVRRIYRYATGRLENDYDLGQIEKLSSAFAAAGQRFAPLLTALVQDDGFLNVSAPK